MGAFGASISSRPPPPAFSSLPAVATVMKGAQQPQSFLENSLPGGYVVQPMQPASVTEVDKVNAFGQVVERDFVSRSGGVTEIDRANASGQVFERDFILGGNMPLATIAPQVPMRTISPQVTQSFRPVGVTEVDKVNAFGQVVERDFVSRSGAVTEIDRANAFGQVFERDFIVGGSMPVATIGPQALRSQSWSARAVNPVSQSFPQGSVGRLDVSRVSPGHLESAYYEPNRDGFSPQGYSYARARSNLFVNEYDQASDSSDSEDADDWVTPDYFRSQLRARTAPDAAYNFSELQARTQAQDHVHLGDFRVKKAQEAVTLANAELASAQAAAQKLQAPAAYARTRHVETDPHRQFYPGGPTVLHHGGGIQEVEPYPFWVGAGTPAARLEPNFSGGEWSLVAPVDLKGIENRQSRSLARDKRGFGANLDHWLPAGTLAQHNEDLQIVDEAVRRLDAQGQLPTFPPPRHWKEHKSCPIA